MGLALGARNHKREQGHDRVHVPGLVRVEKGRPRSADAFGEVMEDRPQGRPPRLGLTVGVSGFGQKTHGPFFFPCAAARHLVVELDLNLTKTNTHLTTRRF